MKPIRPTLFWSDRSDTKIGNIVIGFNSGCFCFSNIHAYKYLQSVELHYLFLGFCVSPMVFVYHQWFLCITNGFCVLWMISVYHQWFLLHIVRVQCIMNKDNSPSVFLVILSKWWGWYTVLASISWILNFMVTKLNLYLSLGTSTFLFNKL